MPVEYKNLEIELSLCGCKQREVRILESPIDRPRARLRIDDRELVELNRQVDLYNDLLLDPDPRKALDEAKKIGRRLFRLLSVDDVGDTLRETLLLLESERERRDVAQRLRFSFGQGDYYDPQLATLPWELICDPRTGDRFLGGEPMTQTARYLEISRKIKPLAVGTSLRVLAVLSSPVDQPHINLGRQELSLRRAVQPRDGSLDLHILERPTLKDLGGALAAAQAEGRPFHVLHFLGHGELNEYGDGSLYFEGRDRKEEPVRSQVLARLLSDFRDLRLVLLATCSGAKLPRVAGLNPFTGSASALIAANIPAVVAMQFTISERAAAWFTEAFYKELAARSSLERAVAKGRLEILTEEVDSLEWATPVLFLRCPDGVIFRTSPSPPISEKTDRQGGVHVSATGNRVGRDMTLKGRVGNGSAGDSTSVQAEGNQVEGSINMTGSES